MATENREGKTVPSLAYFDHPTHPRTWSTSTLQNQYHAGSILAMMAVLATFIPVAYAQGANGGVYFRDIRGGLYYVTTQITNVTSKVVDLLGQGVCEATLEKIASKNAVTHLVSDFCKRPRIGGGIPDPTTFIKIYSIGETKVNQYFVDCLENFFTKSCYEFFSAEFNQTMRVAVPATLAFVAILGAAFYYFTYRPANIRSRATRPVINNSETDVSVSAPTFQNRFKMLEDKLQAMKNDIDSLKDDNLSREYQLLLLELNNIKESHSCPIHHDIMNIPTTLNSGITYDQDTITQHLKNSNKCPLSKKLVTRAVPSVDIFRKNTINNNLSTLESKVKMLATKIEQRLTPPSSEEKQPVNDNAEINIPHRKVN